MIKWYFIGSLCLFMLACASDEGKSLYLKEIEEWRSARLASLTKPNGWTTLIGLFWLEQGRQSFGSGANHTIKFPAGPSDMGFFEVDTVVRVILEPDAGILVDGNVIDSLTLQDDLSGQPTMLQWQSYHWFIIKRGDKYGVRLRDTLAPGRFSLKSLPHYEVDKKWQVEAKFIPADSGYAIPITNMVGQTEQNLVPGHVEFSWAGETYRLAALPGGDHEYFIIIADETTGVETYGGGRYLYIPKADAQGRTVIDFNKAYNPPCVFSPYATCPLPPKENHLPFKVTAGEKNIEGH